MHFNNESQFQLHRAEGRQLVWSCVGERCADVNVVNRVPQGGGVMVWAYSKDNKHNLILSMAI